MYQNLRQEYSTIHKNTGALGRLSSLGGVLYGFCALVPFFCVADLAFGRLQMLPANPTVLCVVALLPFCVLVLGRGIHHRDLACVTALVSRNAGPIAALLLVGGISLAWSILPGAYWDESGKWIFLTMYGVCISLMSLAVGACRPIIRALPHIIIVSQMLILGSVWYDMVYSGVFAGAENRAAGFSGNANYTALVAVLLCAGGLHFGMAPKFIASREQSAARGSGPEPHHRGLLPDVILLVLTFLIVVTTMSRSGLVNFAALVCAFVYLRFMRSRLSPHERSVGIFLIVGVACAVVSVLPAVSDYISSNSGGKTRLARFLNNERVDDGSAGTRLAAVHDSIRLINESPIVGYGTGYSRTMFELPHNMYLQQWVNNGLLGLLAYIGLLMTAFVTFMRRGCRNGQVLILCAAVGGVFSHNLLDQRPFLILLGLFLAASLREARGIGMMTQPYGYNRRKAYQL